MTKRFGQKRNILRSRPQRGQKDLHHPDAKEEILTKFSLADQLLQTPVGGCNQTDIHLNQSVSTHPLECPLSQDPQKLDLRCRINLPNLVQKDRPAVGLLKTSHPPLGRTGKTSLLMPEKLTLQQLRGKGGTVDRNKRRASSGTQPMQCASHQLLPSPTLPLQKDTGLAVRHLPHLIQHLLHGLRFPKNPIQTERPIQLGTKLDILPFHLDGLHRPPQQQLGPVQVQRLGHIVVGTLLDRLDRAFHRAICGHDDTRRRGRVLLAQMQNIQPAFASQAQIGQNHIHRLGLQQISRCLHIHGQKNLKIVLQGSTQRFPGVLFVIHNKQLGLHSVEPGASAVDVSVKRWILRSCIGICNLTDVPFPSRLVI